MRRSFLVTTMPVLGLATLLLSQQPAAGADDGPAVLQGKPAPAIALKTLDGQAQSLADQKGKVVLIDMWATWCPPCRASLPHVQAAATDASLAKKGLVVWAVNDKETQQVVEKFMQSNHYTFPVLMDTQGDVLKAYKVIGIPTTIIVGRDGVVKETFVGFGGDATAKQIDAAIEKALAEPAQPG